IAGPGERPPGVPRQHPGPGDDLVTCRVGIPRWLRARIRWCFPTPHTCVYTNPSRHSPAPMAGAGLTTRHRRAGRAAPVRSPRVDIQASTWSVPFAWFVPFAADERWLVLGASSERGEGGRATAAGTRTLVYATAMSQARTRVTKALGVIRPARSPRSATPWGGDPAALLAELREVGAWLEEFHPHSLVELDYGGLVHLLDDGALCSDQSVAE